MYWIHTGKSICSQICSDPRKLDNWVFSGRGASGVLFCKGEFPYSLTGSMARFHGTKITASFVDYFLASISVYNRHPMCILTLKSVFDGTKYAAALYTRLHELHTEGPLSFYSYIVGLERVEATLYFQSGTGRELKMQQVMSDFKISTIPWAVNKSHLVKIVIFRTATAIPISAVNHVFEECINMAVVLAVTGVDAILLRLFVPDIHKSFIPTGLTYN